MVPRTIFALQENDNSGKTTTITFLVELMKRKGYVVELDKYKKNSKEFFVVLERFKVRIGLCTYGDSFVIITTTCQRLIDEDCCIIVCACHSKGRTVEAVESFEGYRKIFIDKTIAMGLRNQSVVNMNDAEEILNQIESLLD